MAEKKDLEEVDKDLLEREYQKLFLEHIEMKTEMGKIRAVLGVILDSIDYTNGACRPNEPIGGVLPVQILNKAKELLKETKDNG
jgi:hypothetical protein